ncbi:putative methyltransferase-domain-containing protein [Chytriomyces cf. hyalinus JEL632]|nr:putative methyltransferase-domain-containing protein [Chytriomyces cf. hyalinus JEL632]
MSKLIKPSTSARTPHHRIDKANLFSLYSGFLNTGNVRIWNSEHVMAYLAAIKNPVLFRGKSVLELGSGMTGLAGLAIASAANPASVHVTDGNPASVASLQSNIARNLNCFTPSVIVRAEQLLWGEKNSIFVDVIVGGDCTFDTNAHEPLVDTIIACLNASGVAYLLCPRRGNSLLQFYQLCHSKSDGFLQVQWIENYDDDVWAIHAEKLDLAKSDANIYNAGKEYPIMIKISRLPTA